MHSRLFENRVEHLVSKVKHYLISRWGKLHETVSCELFYEAFSYSFREEVMPNWTACFRSYQEKNSRMLYYLSMEYLPGKILANALKTLDAEEVAKEAMRRLGRNYDEIMHQEREPGLGNGGLGRLASCFLDSLATLKIPTIGYGLRYQYGTFEQEICYGNQIERPDRWLNNPYPWDYRRNDRQCIVKFGGTVSEVENDLKDKWLDIHDYEEVRVVPFDIPIIGHSKDLNFSVATMRLWSTKESPRNFRLQVFNTGRVDEAAENTLLTDVLYPNDNHEIGKRFRLKQEYLLVSASLQDIYRRHLEANPNLDNLAEKACIQINDTHPALLVAEMMRTLTKGYHFSWDRAWEITSNSIYFTNHTVMAEALEVWKKEKLENLLPRQYKIIEMIDAQFNATLKNHIVDENILSKLKIIDNEQVRMANLAIYGSKRVNGVAKLHTEILKNNTFQEFHKLYPEKIINVTNGVTPRRWLLHCNPLLVQFIDKRLGKDWQYDFQLLKNLERFATDEDSLHEFLEIKKQNKNKVSEFIHKYNEKFRSFDPYVDGMVPLGNDSIYDMHIKRIHEYKRQLLKLIHAIIVYQELLTDQNARKAKRSIFFGGKAAPGYEKARDLIYLIHVVAKRINQNPKTKDFLRIIFIENYNVNKAEILIPGADVSEQISLAGKEASGTGNMKLSLNGALTVGTEDGANIEMRQAVGDQWWPFRFGADKEEIEKLRLEMNYEPRQIYSSNERIKRAIDSFKDDTFSDSDFERQVCHQFHHYLIEGFNPDPYFVLHDLESYYQIQRQVEDLFSNPFKWAEFAIHNIAKMTSFSSDESIRNYASKIWNINAVNIDHKTMKKVRSEFDLASSCLENCESSSQVVED